ncbi:MAG: hypothetical protein B6I32_04425, partial [Desulfobacterium sp. 4572_20]
MSQKTVKNAFIFHRHKKIPFEIPSQWNILTFAKLDEYHSQKDVRELTKNALKNPIHAKALKDSLSPSDKVAIIVEDLTRASPKKLILETLMGELNAAHISSENICVIIALGTHRGLTPEELESTFGREMIDRYEFVNHDCHATDLMPVGRLKTGRQVKINRKVHEATFRIGIGSIFPHPMNGFGGGGKILFPGVSDFDSIREQRDQVYDLVSGDLVQAHLAGIEKSRGIICQKFTKKSDLTIITSFPYAEGPQIVKPLAPAAMVTKEGGCIILAADCDGNLPEAFIESFERFHSRYGDNLLGGVLDHFENNRLIMEEGAIDFNMALAMTLAIQHRFKIILVSKDITREVGEKMGFIYAEHLKEAFDLSA